MRSSGGVTHIGGSVERGGSRRLRARIAQIAPQDGIRAELPEVPASDPPIQRVDADGDAAVWRRMDADVLRACR